MQDDQTVQSRFGYLADLATNTTRTLSAQLSAARSRYSGAPMTPSSLVIGVKSLQSRWNSASTAVGALSLGMAAIAIGSLIAPSSSTAIPLAAEQTSVRIVSALPPIALSETTIQEEASIFDSLLTDDAKDEREAVLSTSLETEIVAASAPLTFQTAHSLLTDDIRRTARETVAVGSGDTLMQLLLGAGAARSDAHRAIAAMKPLYDPRKLRTGQELDLSFDEHFGKDENGEAELQRTLAVISMKTDVDREVSIRRTEDGKYSGLELVAELETGNVRARGTINSSLFLAAAEAGVPAAITVEMIRMYSYDIDFQRDIRTGDTFEVLFSREYDEDGTAVREGNVLYASMTVRGKERALWRYEAADSGAWDYYDEQGRSMKKFLMKTPIDGARISSSFGNRRHPILGYTRLHAGTDFAAPTGTPIYAAGNGTVEMAQRNGSFGNYVRIRHGNGYQTAYAHMSRFGRGIRSGTRVRQGEIIGYVGTTGRSTGPHLHYEVMRNGSKVNPQTIRVPTGRSLSGNELASYQRARTSIDTLMAEAQSLTKVAEADIDN